MIITKKDVKGFFTVLRYLFWMGLGVAFLFEFIHLEAIIMNFNDNFVQFAMRFIALMGSKSL